MPVAVFASFRFDGPDGVSVVAATWMRAFRELGFDVTTVAGIEPADVVLPGLTATPDERTAPPSPGELAEALAGADLVVVENLLSIPLNLRAARAVAGALRGRPALLHHHDPPWQRERFASVTELPPDDPAWVHVTLTHHTQREFAERGLEATAIWNVVAPPSRPGDRDGTRAALGVAPGERLLLHPVRAIARKDVPAALRLAEAVGGTYWLLGPAEDGYGPELEGHLASARCPVRHSPSPTGCVVDAYAAADAVLYPSTWEGFGLPPLEAALARRPVAVGPYPVAEELRSLGFRWLPADDPAPLAAALADPASVAADLDADEALVRRHFSPEVLRERLAALLDERGWR